MKTAKTLAAAMMAMGVATSALAYETTLNVPVKVSNLHPAVIRVAPYCKLVDSMGNNLLLGGMLVTANAEVKNGSFDGIIPVKASLDSAKAAMVTGYWCKLSFQVPGAWAEPNEASRPEVHNMTGTFTVEGKF